MRRDLCFALIRKEAMSVEGKRRWRRGTFIHGEKCVRGYRSRGEGVEKRKLLNSFRASIENCLIRDGEACLRNRLAIVLRVIEGP